MKKNYFVLYEKSDKDDWLNNTEKRELYHRRKGFSDLEKAITFAVTVLEDEPIIARAGLTIEEHEKGRIKDPDNPYVIATYFLEKYGYTGTFGEGEEIPTYEIIRCNPDQLEATLWDLAKEKPSKIYGGIELKLFPKDLKEAIQKGIEKDGEYKLTKSDQE